MDRSYLEEREKFVKETASLIEQGSLDKARKSAIRRCSRYPGDVDAWLVRAACAVRADEFEEALSILKNLEKLIPGWPLISECIGDVCRNSGRNDEALKAYRKALGPDENLRRRVEDKAADMVGEQNGRYSPYEHTLALVEAYRRAGSSDRAVEVLKSLLRDDPTNRKIAGLLREIEKREAERTRLIVEELSRWLSVLEGERRGDG